MRDVSSVRRGPATVMLTLQLQLPFQVGLVGFGLMASAPDRPGDDEGRFDATLDQTPGNTTDFLE